MARLPRIFIPGCSYHVIQRGNNKDPCFYSEADYKAYLSFLKVSSANNNVKIHAYVLMTNHVHLLVTPKQDGDISRMMQSLGRKYVRQFNFLYGRTGTLWEGRFKLSIVDTERYLLTVYRYIELNPVRANMVNHASEYPWSSYLYNSVGRKISLITPHREYLSLGTTDNARQLAYRKLFKGQMTDKDIKDIRHSINTGWVLGSERFKKKIEHKLGRKRIGHGGDRKSDFFRDQVT
jgi:putative transposase